MPTPAAPRTSSRRVTCAQCATVLDRQSLLDGHAELRGARLICRRCLERESATRQSQAVALWKRRLPLAAGTAVILGLGLFVIVRQQREQRQLAQTQFANERAAIDEFLRQNVVASAVGKRNELQTTARDFAGTPAGDDAARLAAEADQKITLWLTQHFGTMDAQEHDILLRLLASYPGANASGALQLQAVHVNGAALSIRYAGQETETHSGATRNPAQEEARRFLVNVFDLFPEINAIELQWLRANTGGEFTTVQTYSVARTQYKSLSMDGADPGNLPNEPPEPTAHAIRRQ